MPSLRSNRPNPLRIDPTRTAALRRKFETELIGRFERLKTKLRKYLLADDKLELKALVGNARFKFNARPERIEEFRKWLATQVQDEILGDPNTNEYAWWDKFIQEGYRQGAGRAFDDTKKPYARGYAKTGGVSDFYKGTKYQFLQSSFAQPETVEKVQLLASRVYTELKGVTDAMSQKMTRDLTEGLAKGDNPYTIAKQLSSGVDSVGEVRSRAIARTEIVRAHNEGQLDALEGLGVEEVGVMVEWSTAMNACPLCTPMEGTVFTVKEARGMLPRHPNCRCSYIPANVGESTKGQKRGKESIEKAIDESVAAELPKTKPRTLEEQKERTTWQGVDKTITPERPTPSVSPMGKGKEPPPPPVKTEIPPKPPAPIAPAIVPVPVSHPTAEKTLKERIANPKLEGMRVEFLDNFAKAQAKKNKLDAQANEKFQAYMELSSRIGNWAQERDKYGEIVYQIVLDDLRKEQATLEVEWIRLNKESQALQEGLTTKALKKAIKLPEKHQMELAYAKPIETTNCEGKAIKTLKQGNVFKGQAKKAKEFIADILSNDPDKFIWGKIEMQIHQLPDGDRAFHRAGSNRYKQSGAFMDRGDPVHTHIHEIGHRIEVEMQGVKEKAIEFRNMRIAESGSKAIKMSELCPDCNYADHEIGNPDDWGKTFGEHHAAYIGKDYGDRATEVISMGMEMLYKNPVKFAENDPEYFKFIVGVLRGDI